MEYIDLRMEVVADLCGRTRRAELVLPGHRRKLLGTIAADVVRLLPDVYRRWLDLMGDVVAETVRKAGGEVTNIEVRDILAEN